MRKIVFDIETKNIFKDVGKADPALLDLSVVCIHDSQTDRYHSFLEEELPRLWPFIESADMLIGYNSDHFDIPLLNKYYPGDLSKIKSLDLLREIKNAFGKRLRLDAIAEGTLGMKKSGKGLDAIVWWKNGEIEKIKAYCLKDVEITKNIYDYACKNNAVRYKDMNEIREIKLETSSWEARKTNSMTQSLPF